VERRIGATAAAAVLAIAALTACSSPTARVDDAVDQSIAAIASARIALDLQADGRMFTTTASATVTDARRELIGASRSVAETDATTTAEADRRDETQAAVTDAIVAVDSAADALAGVGDLDTALREVERSESVLRALAEDAP